MTLVKYQFHRGEPIAFGDQVESGTVLAGHTMRARMKPVQGRSTEMPGSSVPNVSPAFTTAYSPATGSEAAQWIHTMTAAQSAALAAGDYIADSSLLLDGEVIWTSDPVLIELVESASAVV